MFLSRTRIAALLALSLVATSCVDSDATGASGEGPGFDAGIAFSPIFSETANSSALQQGPISRIRVRVERISPRTLLGTQTFEVNPSQDAWDLNIGVELPSEGAAQVELFLELISVGANNEETVEWSGVSDPITVSGGTPTEVQNVPVGVGPLSNVGVTAIAIGGDGLTLDEQATGVLTASVTTQNNNTPVVVWASTDPGIATVDQNGVVTGVAAGTTQIVAAAGTVEAQAQVTVLPIPTSIEVSPAVVDVDRPGQVLEFQARVLDARGNLMPDEGVVFSSLTQTLLEFQPPSTTANGVHTGTFEVLGESATPANVTATSVRRSSVVGTAVVNIDFVEADLSVTKTASVSEAFVDDEITWTVQVTNLGPDPATSVEILDALDDALIFGSASASHGAYNEGSGIWTVGTLGNGETATLTIVTVAGEGGEGRTIVNEASAGSRADHEFDPNTGNNSASAEVQVMGRRTDVAVTAALNVSNPFETDQIRVTVTATNDDAGAQPDEVQVDVLPSGGLTLVSGTPERGTFDPNTGRWSIPNLAPGQSVDLAVDLVVRSGTAGQEQAVTGQFAGMSGAADTDATNNAQTVRLTPRGVDLQVTKTVDRQDPVELEEFGYTISVKNTSERAVGNVQISESIPERLTLVRTEPAGALVSGVWTIPTLAAGATQTLRVFTRVKLGRAKDGQIVNEARLLGSLITDTNPNNNRGEAAINPRLRAADLSVVGSLSSEPIEGEEVVIGVTVANAGPYAADDILVDIPLPDRLTFRGVNTDVRGGFSPTTDEWRIGTLEAGASTALRLTVYLPVTSDDADRLLSDLIEPIEIPIAIRTFAGASDPDLLNNTSPLRFTPTQAASEAIDRSYSTLGNTELAAGEWEGYSRFPVRSQEGLLTGLGGAQLSESSVGIFFTELGAYVQIAVDGSFSYVPPAGLTGTTDSFSYALDNETSAVVTVMIAEEAVWYLDGDADYGEGLESSLLAGLEGGEPFESAAAECECDFYGTSVDPFTSTGDLSDAPPGTAIFVFATTEPYGPVTVGDDVTLIGEAWGLAPPGFGQLIPPGPHPQFATYSGDYSPAMSVYTGASIFGVEAQSHGPSALPAIAAVEAGGATFDNVRITGDGPTMVDIASSSGLYEFNGLSVDNALGSFVIDGGDPQVEVDVEHWQQPSDPNVQWAFWVEDTGGSLLVTGNRLQLENGGVYAEDNYDGFIQFDAPLEVRGGVGSAEYGNAFYLWDNQSPITFASIDADLGPQAYPLYAYYNDDLTLHDVRYQASGQAQISIYESRLNATFSRLHYSEDGSEYSGDAVRLRYLRDGSEVNLPDVSIDAYGGTALVVSGEDYATLQASPNQGSLVAPGARGSRELPTPADVEAMTPDRSAHQQVRRAEIEARRTEGESRGPALTSLRESEPATASVTSDVVVRIPNPGLSRLAATSGYGYYGGAFVGQDVILDVHLGLMQVTDGESVLELYNTTGSLVADEVGFSNLNYTPFYFQTGDPVVELNIAAGAQTVNGYGLVEMYGTTGAQIGFHGGIMRHQGFGGTGIYMFNNTGSSVLFDTQLELVPGSGGGGIWAQSGGTLEILGNDNIIETDAGLAVNIEGVEIGPGGINFQRIDILGNGSGSPSTGIRLQDTGVMGPFRVTGQPGVDGSGGVFSNMATGRSIALHDAHNVELQNMTLSGSHAIDAHAGASGITLRNVQATGSGGELFYFWGATGDVLLDDVDGSGGTDVLSVETSGSEVLDLMVQNSSFSSPGSGNGVLLTAGDGGTLRSTFDGLYVASATTPGGAAVRLRTTSAGRIESSIRNASLLDSNVGLQVDDDGSTSHILFDIRNSTIGNALMYGIDIQAGAGTIDGVILDNNIDGASGMNGIRGVADAVSFESLTGAVNLLIQNNNIGPFAEDGVRLNPGYMPSGTANLHVLRNAIEGGYSALDLQNHGATYCLNVGSNMLTGSGEDPDGSFAFTSGVTNIERIGGPGAAANVIAARFESEGGSDDNWDGIGSANGVAHGSCAMPTLLSGLGNIPPTVIGARGGTGVGFIYNDLPIYAVDPDDASLAFSTGNFYPVDADQSAVSDLQIFPKYVTVDFDTNVNGVGLFELEVIATDGSGAQHQALLVLDIISAGVRNLLVGM